VNFKNFFKRPKKKAVTAGNINWIYDFDNLEDCRHFLNNLFLGDARVKHIQLTNGLRVKMEDIPEDQIIQRAKELRSWVQGKEQA
jgi:hypothetical protein